MDEYGFLITPYRQIKSGKMTENVVWMRADEESEAYLAPADTPVDEHGKLKGTIITARYQTDFVTAAVDHIQYMDISPKQMVGVSAGLIPFLEHDDANRALMGSNMQRQAVPLLVAEPPIVATGLERAVAINSGMVVKAGQDGTVTYVDSSRVIIDHNQIYKLRKYVGLNERTCLNQKPIVTGRPAGQEGGDPRRRCLDLQGRAVAGPERPGRVHGLGRLQLRRRHHHQREARAGGRVHVDPHRGVRDRDPRDQARPRGIHPRYSQRLREGAAEPRR